MNKTLLPFLILKILQKYSDEEHHLSQSEIIDLLASNHGVNCERKAVARHIRNLRELGYDIIQDKGYYLMSLTFDPTEARMLLDSVITSSYIPEANAKRLIKGLLEEQSIYFESKYNYQAYLSYFFHVSQSQIFHNIDIILEALDTKRKIAFYYSHYGADKKLHKVKQCKYVKSPYQLLSKKGEYYLICDINKEDRVDNFRLEFISEIEILDEPTNGSNDINWAAYIDEHIYMLQNESTLVTMKVATWVIEQMFDFMGFNIAIKKYDEEHSIVTARVNKEAILYFALQYILWVEVLSPSDIRDAIKELVKLGGEKYLCEPGSYKSGRNYEICRRIIDKL